MDYPSLHVQIVRFLSDSPQPGIVECQLVDAAGREWFFIDKVPTFTSIAVDGQSRYPQPGSIACAVIKKRRNSQGQKIITIDTDKPWGVESTTGETTFDVRPEQIDSG
jgi:hypothetical protein